MFKIKREQLLKDWKRWLCLAGGAIMLFLAVLMAMGYSENRASMILAMGFIVFLPGGIFLLYRGIIKSDTEAVIVGVDKPTEKVNCLNIYAAKDKDTEKIYPVKVAFEWQDNPTGQPQQCLNNNKWYHVNIFDISKEELVRFSLPDSQYFDPREFANVITMPAHKKLFERQASLLQKVAPWVMVIAFCASLFGMVATAPTGG